MSSSSLNRNLGGNNNNNGNDKELERDLLLPDNNKQRVGLVKPNNKKRKVESDNNSQPSFKVPNKPISLSNRTPSNYLSTPSSTPSSSLSSNARDRLNNYRKFRNEFNSNNDSRQISKNKFEDFKNKSNKSNYLSWDSTPRRSSNKWDDDGHHRLHNLVNEDYESEQQKLDREWYNNLGEESEISGDFEHNPFEQYEDLDYKFNQKINSNNFKKLSAKQIQFNKDNDAWESNRMYQSGIKSRSNLDFDFEDDNQSKVHVLVHDLKPPFLDGKILFTKQLEPVNPIKDPTSDMAVFARKGSALVREKRTQAERQRVS